MTTCHLGQVWTARQGPAVPLGGGLGSSQAAAPAQMTANGLSEPQEAQQLRESPLHPLLVHLDRLLLDTIANTCVPAYRCTSIHVSQLLLCYWVGECACAP